MIRSIIKRDGRKVLYDQNKIAQAILKAMEATHEGDAESAARIANAVQDQLETARLSEAPGIEYIQDAVEKELMNYGFNETAKAYILYRANRTRAREANTSLMHTIGLISVLQNVRTNRLPQEAENAISSLPHRWLLDYNQTPEQVNASLFFTARAFPVLCPVRSLLLQRINSAIDFFDGQTDSQAIKPPQYAGGGFTYLQKAQRREASLLPLAPGSTPDNPEITFAPLYGTMRNPDASEQDYWNEIVNVCQTRYFDCIKAYSPKNVALARIDFLREYFQNNGSLYVLPDLKEGDDQSKPCGFQYEPVPDRKACKKVGYPIDVALSVVNSFKQNLDKRSTDLRSLIWQDLRGEQLRQRIQNVIQAIEELKLLLSSHVRELSSKKEIQVLMEASAQHDTFEGQAADWVQRKFQGGNQQREIQEIKRYKSLYNNTICSILIGEVALEEGMERILDHCAKAVLSTQDDTDSKIFFDRLAVVCSNPDELTLRVKRIEDSLHYALKFHHGNVSGQDYRFTIGSTGNNQLFSNLTDGLKASGIPVDEFDRLEVIRFSSPFGADGLQIMNIRNVEA